MVVLATVMIGCRERNMGSYIPSGRVRTLIKKSRCQVTDNQGGSASAPDALKVLEITEFLAAQQDNSVAIVIPYRRLTRVSLHGVIKQHISSLSLRKQQQ